METLLEMKFRLGISWTFGDQPNQPYRTEWFNRQHGSQSHTYTSVDRNPQYIYTHMNAVIASVQQSNVYTMAQAQAQRGGGGPEGRRRPMRVRSVIANFERVWSVTLVKVLTKCWISNVHLFGQLFDWMTVCWCGEIEWDRRARLFDKVFRFNQIFKF